jgi:DNA-binding response OmpR family regulator
MKQILIIDESPLFREYLRIKLTENNIEVDIAVNGLDGISKIRTFSPDLIIMDYHLSRQGYLEVLKQKKADLNTAKIPAIVTAQEIDQKRIIEMAPYNVKKVFTKPVKIDALFATISELLGVSFALDKTPGIVEVHVNDDIIFIEIAQGLNRDKLDLLRFKIMEVIELYEIRVPKFIIMLSDIKLGFADGPNLQKLLATISQASNAKNRHIRILTRDSFVKEFIEGRKEYAEIGVLSSLQYAMDGLLTELDSSMEYGEKKAEIIVDKVLAAGPAARDSETVHLRFDAETKVKLNEETIKAVIQNLRIAVVDNDPMVQEQIRKTFEKIGAAVAAYSRGGDYIASVEREKYDLVFLNLMMPDMDGFEVLRALQVKNIPSPVIALSPVTRRDTVIRAFQMGIKSYLVKPLEPGTIFKKSMEILRTNF